MRAAVASIYGPLTQPSPVVSIPATSEKAAIHITVAFSDSENPHNNINDYQLLRDGLTRVHPTGYAALLHAAIENGIGSLNVTSCWRPLLGSIAHRAGLGLDVNYVGEVRLNREKLRNANAVNTANVSEKEKSLFNEVEASEKEVAALRRQGAPNATIRDAQYRTAGLREEWSDERNSNEPQSVRTFRNTLLKDDYVKQLFDPWYMDLNTHDQQSPEPNMQRPTPSGQGKSIEQLHANHLHITVNEPKIL